MKDSADNIPALMAEIGAAALFTGGSWFLRLDDKRAYVDGWGHEMALDRAVSHRALQEKVKVLSRTPARPQQFGSLLGESPSMQKLFSQMSHVADQVIAMPCHHELPYQRAFPIFQSYWSSKTSPKS